MQSLVPSISRSANVFRAGSSTLKTVLLPVDGEESSKEEEEESGDWLGENRSAKAVQSLSPSSTVTAALNTDILSSSLPPVFAATPIPAVLATPALAPSISLRNVHKRSHSAAFSNSASGASTPTTSSKRTTGPGALEFLGQRLGDFTTAFCDTNTKSIATTPERKMRAIERAQDIEADLNDEELVSLITVFETDGAAADTYLAIKRETLRKIWVQKKLFS
jgi:hypothetical protein